MRVLLMVCVAVASAGVAHAGTVFGFSNVTANSVTDAAAGEAQLAVEVIDAVAGFADFRFTNTGADAMSITDIYFNNAPVVFADLTSIDDSDPGVEYSEGAAPANPPGVAFSTAFSLDSDAGMGGVQAHGVNPGEWLIVRMELAGGVTFAELLDAFDNGLAIAIHVQGYAGGGSESFVTDKPAPLVPLPTGAALALAGICVGAGVRRRAIG